MKVLALIIAIILSGCADNPHYFTWTPTWEPPGVMKSSLISSSSSEIVHGRVERCVEFDGENCSDWEIYGFGCLHKISGDWESAGICTVIDMLAGPCEITWDLNDGNASASLIPPEEDITFRDGEDLLKITDLPCASSWKGTGVLLHDFYAKTIEYIGSDMYDRVECTEEGCESIGGCRWNSRGGCDYVRLEDMTSTLIEVYGGDGDDTIYGCTNCTNHIYGGGDDDYIIGGNYSDFLWGDDGHDHIEGGSGDDHIYGGDGCDVLYGGPGDDSILDQKGVCSLNGGIIGGIGKDTIDASGVSGAGFVSGRDCVYSSVTWDWECTSHASDVDDVVDCGCWESYCGEGDGAYSDCEDHDENDYCDDDC